MGFQKSNNQNPNNKKYQNKNANTRLHLQVINPSNIIKKKTNVKGHTHTYQQRKLNLPKKETQRKKNTITQIQTKKNRNTIRFEKQKEPEEKININKQNLSLIHISEPTRPLYISYAVFCLKKKKTNTLTLISKPLNLILNLD
eukprot:TRINITY_DN71219_c0_g1_i4.p2 TRINITY_DN71219_c0_g1~~TRINITY_DN71219_c0_g1_i4.p2  ORF type:complete len:143 (+),score=18.82 TRINITY_DN71219_c0_g1_i4:179-607(+)